MHIFSLVVDGTSLLVKQTQKNKNSQQCAANTSFFKKYKKVAIAFVAPFHKKERKCLQLFFRKTVQSKNISIYIFAMVLDLTCKMIEVLLKQKMHKNLRKYFYSSRLINKVVKHLGYQF